MSVASITETTQYLTFNLAEEIFALHVFNIREVLDYQKITKVPQAPAFMRGVINLRGSVVPVIDMRLKFGMSETEKKKNTCIIVMEVDLDGDQSMIGALADSVQEVIELDPQHIDPAPKIGTKWNTAFIKGIGKHNDNFIIILDIARIFSLEELVLFKDTGSLEQNESGEEAVAAASAKEE